MNDDSGFSLIEILVVIMVLAFLSAGLFRFFSYGLRSARHVQDTSDQTQNTAILFRSLEFDLRGIVPWPVVSTKGNRAGVPEYSPSSQRAKEFLFWTNSNGSLQRVRYLFDATHGEVRREVVNGSGQGTKIARFCSGFTTNLEIRDETGDSQTLHVVLTSEGKLKKQKIFNRVFTTGYVKPSEAISWIHNNLD